MIYAQYYCIKNYNIFIKFQNDKIIINMIDMEQNIYENIISNYNSHYIFIINSSNEISSLINLYDYIVMLFDEIQNKYNIEIVNNNKYIHLTFRESNNSGNNIKCMLWIKIQKYKNISDDTYLEIITEEIAKIEENVRKEQLPKSYYEQFIIYIQSKLSLLN